MNHFTVAIDGPAGAGKSSIAQLVSEALGAIYLDTGAMYRAVGLYMVRNGVDIHDVETITARAAEAKVDIEYVGSKQCVLLLGENVNEYLRTKEMDDASSAVSAVPEVRRLLVARQQEIARERSVVMDGRDIGTKVLPDATLKIFLTATPEERANRRYKQLRDKGIPACYEKILADINQRDYNDSHRAASPLTKAEEAVALDSSNMTKEEVAEFVLALLRERMGA
jgi:cytidylate kinase